jgi:hypothetical protein
MAKSLGPVITVILVLIFCFGICIGFTILPTVQISEVRSFQDVSIRRFAKDSFQQRRILSDICDSNSMTLRSFSGSDLSDAILISAAFAGIALYTYQNPDTSDKIRDAVGGMGESSSTSIETTPVPAPTSATVVPTPVVVVKVPVKKSKEQQELSTLLKTVSKTVEEQSVKLDKIESTKTLTTSSLESTKPKEGKIKFVLKVVKKVVMPWKAWASL